MERVATAGQTKSSRQGHLDKAIQMTIQMTNDTCEMPLSPTSPPPMVKMRRSTHYYCPLCALNLSDYGQKTCDGCGFIFAFSHPLLSGELCRFKTREPVEKPSLKRSWTV